MEIQVNLEPGHINDAIAKAVVESHLGDALKERIERFLDDTKSYGHIGLSESMKVAVDAELQKIVIKLIHDEYADSIREKVRQQMTDDVISDLVTRAVTKLNSKY